MERNNSLTSEDMRRGSKPSGLSWFQTVLLCHDLLHTRNCEGQQRRRRRDSKENEDDDEGGWKRRRRRIWKFVIWSLASGILVYCLKRHRKQLAIPVQSKRLSFDWTRLKRIGGWETVLIATLKQWLQRMLQQPPYRKGDEVPLSTLWASLQAQDMREAVWLDSERGVAFRESADDTSWKRVTQVPEAAKSQLMQLLRQHASDGLKVSTEPPSMASRLLTPALTAVPFVYLGLMWYVLRDVYSSGNQLKMSPKPRSTTTFRDVAGLYEAKRDVEEVVDVLLHPQQYRRLGISTPRAILLYGPPGSGKTLLARAVAGEAKVGQFLVCSGSDFVDTYVGRGASRIRSLFAKARGNNRFWRKSQRTTGATTTIIFMDEIDALAKTRGSGLTSNDERDQTLNQLLVELDGFATSHRTDVLFIGATNRRDVLDPALLRRMDRQVKVGLPASAEERLEILNLHARRIESTCDLQETAQRTDGCSGSHLRTIVNEAALLAMRDNAQVVKEHHFLQAAEKIYRQQVRTTSPTYYRNALLPSFP